MTAAVALFAGVGLAHGSAIQVTPSQAPPGTTITITGTGFEAGTKVTVTLESALSVTNLGTTTADDKEGFTLKAVVPDSAKAGLYMVKAAGGDGETTASLTITAATAAQTDQMQPQTNAQVNAQSNMQANAQPADQPAAQASAAQPKIVHERTTAEDVIIGVIFTGLAVIGLSLVFASRVHSPSKAS